MVPFTLRLLWAELPALVATDPGTTSETIARLHGLYTTASQQLEERGEGQPCPVVCAKARVEPAADTRPLCLSVAGDVAVDLDDEKYCCLSTLDAVSQLEDSTEAWVGRRIRTALALVGRYVANQSFTAAVQILQKVQCTYSDVSEVLDSDLACVRNSIPQEQKAGSYLQISFGSLSRWVSLSSPPCLEFSLDPPHPQGTSIWPSLLPTD
jgi:hypothetical protein